MLVRRQYKPGQRYIQLVFETTEGIKLSISRNVQLVRSLTVGKTYHIEGPEYALGSKTYIHEPIATPMPYALKRSRKRRLIIFAIIFIVIILGVGGALLLANHSHPVPLQASPTASKTTPATQETTTTKPLTPDEAVQAANVTPPVTPTPKAAAKSNAPNSTTPTPPAAPSAGAPTTTPDDCDIIPVQFTSSTTSDSTQAVTGVVGQNKVCYPNGRDNAATTTLLQAPVNEVVYVDPNLAPAAITTPPDPNASL
jgi:hypothetical protein